MALFPFNRIAGREPAADDGPSSAPRGQESRALTGWPWPYWPWDTGGPPAYMRVGVDRALRLYSIFGAARLLADSIASMPPVLYISGKDGVPTPAPSAPSLFRQPSVHGTLFQWLHRCVMSMALHGDAIGHVTQRNYLGYPTMVEWLNPQEVDVLDRAPSGPGSFMRPLWYWRGRPMNREDLVHVPWLCMPYHVRGYSPIGALEQSANIGFGAQQFASAWFHNGGSPPGVFKNVNQKVSKEDADTITERITNRLQTRKPLVHGSDWEYTPIDVSMQGAQFAETNQLTATQIAVIYGIPPEMIGGQAGGNLTYNTVSMNALNFLTFSLRPWLVRIESALTNLFPGGQFVRFDTSELLRTDPLTKAQIDQMNLGYYPPAHWSIDEVRRSNYMPSIPADQLPAMYRPGGGAMPGEPANPAPAVSVPLPDTVGGDGGDHPAPQTGPAARSAVFGPSAFMDLLGRRPGDPFDTRGV